jgi:SNW domain-containing protein 1
VPKIEKKSDSLSNSEYIGIKDKFSISTLSSRSLNDDSLKKLTSRRKVSDNIVENENNLNRSDNSETMTTEFKTKIDSKHKIARSCFEEIAETARETEKSLKNKQDQDITTNRYGILPEKTPRTQFIKYLSKMSGPHLKSGPNEHIIQIQEMAMDPLEPPKHKIIKVPRPPHNPPVPLYHSPPRMDPKEVISWKIPPAISNWKNAKGFIIPLDKRLAADGRALQETKINDNFAKLSEALYIAEQKAREDTELRNQIAKEQALRDKERKDAEMRALAMHARVEKIGYNGKGKNYTIPQSHDTTKSLPNHTTFNNNINCARTDDKKEYNSLPDIESNCSPIGKENKKRETSKERRKREERDDIREERRRAKEKERRLMDAGMSSHKQNKLSRDRDRDISERIALGIANVTKLTGEAMYDQRLFGQESGLQSGFGEEDENNAYDKPLFAQGKTNIFHTNKTLSEE